MTKQQLQVHAAIQHNQTSVITWGKSTRYHYCKASQNLAHLLSICCKTHASCWLLNATLLRATPTATTMNSLKRMLSLQQVLHAALGTHDCSALTSTVGTLYKLFCRLSAIQHKSCAIGVDILKHKSCAIHCDILTVSYSVMNNATMM